ncbi:hypothetical protein LWP59_13590 [Amycolatopsis acidiphila]|uniref:DUF4175 domain-containing protein n=1 Tax=Amycolatopsis acidiphila TaxID=715473 RepID=A0A558AJ46_9PSEU|nr:hypothetical protein [Amycolatopsis acidiphila]TVT24285.1 hypothetical protein FNH06_06865 [Amycolatopsis acidiphila]UIJ64222.1 hypothetical protein LWP59_13590 [Amycolatopsis acidiphila]
MSLVDSRGERGRPVFARAETAGSEFRERVIPSGKGNPSQKGFHGEKESAMLGLLALLLLVWLVFIVVGVAVKGLFWLLILGVVLFAVTGVIGFVKREALGRGRH